MAPSTASPDEIRASPRKRAAVADLSERLGRATSAIITDYRGLTVKQIEELRHKLRSEGIEYLVVKNTLARRAADEAGAGAFTAILSGPVGLALGYGDLSAPARVLIEYIRANRRLAVVGGMAEHQIFDAEGVRTLADLPSREVLLSRLAGALESPLSTLAGSLESILSTLAATLEAYRDRLDSTAA